MERALSTIMTLPSNEKELKTFLGMIRKEIVMHGNPLLVMRQLHYALRTITAVLEDDDIKECFKLDANAYGEELIELKKFTAVNDVDDVKIVL